MAGFEALDLHVGRQSWGPPGRLSRLRCSSLEIRKEKKPGRG
jgi:hypothetical protein